VESGWISTEIQPLSYPSTADSGERIQMGVNASQIKEEVKLQPQQVYPTLKSRTTQGEFRDP